MIGKREQYPTTLIAVGPKRKFPIILFVFIPEQAFAMHIMEGFLPIEWALFW